MGPIDLVMEFHGFAAADAALWISARFDVPMIRVGWHLMEPDRLHRPVGYESGMELLVRSGLFGTLSGPARSIAPVLVAMSEKATATAQEQAIQMSYQAMMRYSGIASPNAIRKALGELAEIGFLEIPDAGLCRSPQRSASHYIVTPNSDGLIELAQTFAAQMKTEIADERELRARLRREKTRRWRERANP